MKKALTLLLAFLLFPALATAATLDVNCDQPGKGHTITETLRQLDPAGPNVITFHGTCRENIVINEFDRLTLRAAPGAMLADASGGQEWAVLLITNSRRIKIRNLKISGGQVGVVCSNYSHCDFANNTMDGQSQSGFSINESDVSFSGDVVRNAAGAGIVINRSKAQIYNVISEHNGTGLNISGSSAVAENVNANFNAEAGFFVSSGSNVQIIHSTANNSQIGIQGTSLTTLSLTNDTATNNSMNGVWLSDMSTAFFVNGTYLNNGGPNSNQVECAPYYTVVSNLWTATTGVTNCTVH